MSRILCALIFLVLFACDGHVRVLYLQPPEASEPPWSVASVVIKTSGHEDVIAIVSNVASELSLVTVSSDPHRWMSRNQEFYITVHQDEASYWVVTLLDWPSMV